MSDRSWKCRLCQKIIEVISSQRMNISYKSCLSEKQDAPQITLNAFDWIFYLENNPIWSPSCFLNKNLFKFFQKETPDQFLFFRKDKKFIQQILPVANLSKKQWTIPIEMRPTKKLIRLTNHMRVMISQRAWNAEIAVTMN